jgi:N-acetylmuramic acid 6-phosphate etherase
VVYKRNENNIITGSISCNANPLSQTAQFPDVVVGPEFVTGSSRMKAGTAQKLVLKHDFDRNHDSAGKVKGTKWSMICN